MCEDHALMPAEFNVVSESLRVIQVCGQDVLWGINDSCQNPLSAGFFKNNSCVKHPSIGHSMKKVIFCMTREHKTEKLLTKAVDLIVKTDLSIFPGVSEDM